MAIVVSPSNATPTQYVSDLIRLAMMQIGIVGQGQSASGQDVTDCFHLLNMMLGEWSAQRLSVLHDMDVTFTADGSQSYTMGPGGKIDCQWPARLEAAYARLNNIDTPIQIVRAHEDYDRISLKTLGTLPQYAFLDTSYPLANLYLWPVPTSAYQITLTIMAQLQQFNTPNEPINLPPHYLNALMYSLAVAIAPVFGVPVTPEIAALAKASKQTIKRMNAQIPVLQINRDLTRAGHYNVYSDRVN